MSKQDERSGSLKWVMTPLPSLDSVACLKATNLQKGVTNPAPPTQHLVRWSQSGRRNGGRNGSAHVRRLR